MSYMSWIGILYVYLNVYVHENEIINDLKLLIATCNYYAHYTSRIYPVQYADKSIMLPVHFCITVAYFENI